MDEVIVSDEELAELALAADPDTPVDDDACCLSGITGGAGGLLPVWYMPAPGVGASAATGWRRAAALVVIAAFLLITALGLCNTYGDLGL
jgi:hypothetical protein